MFAKLLKYEWKASSRYLGLLSLAALGTGIVGAVLMRMVIGASSDQLSDTLHAILSIMLAFMFLALFVYAIGAYFFLFSRFYKNKFTDEGYLTFILPVKSWQIFLSSLVNIVVWMGIVILVVIVSVCIMLATGIRDSLQDVSAEEISYLMEQMGPVSMRIASMVVSGISGAAILMSCITVGAVIAKKHKILTAIALFYGISMVQGILTSVLMVSSMMASTSYNTALSALQNTTAAETLIQSVLALGGFFLSIHLMNRKLNLP